MRVVFVEALLQMPNLSRQFADATAQSSIIRPQQMTVSIEAHNGGRHVQTRGAGRKLEFARMRPELE